MPRNGENRTLPDNVAATLNMIASGEALPRVLTTISRMVEELSPGAISSVFLLDDEGKRLWCHAAPSLAPEFRQVMDGLPVGPDVVCCGAAAYRRERVVVGDTSTDPKWREYRDLALAHELRSCWSEPVFSSRGKLLGTVTTYGRTPGEPAPAQTAWVKAAADLVSIAVERNRDQDAIRREREQAKLAATSRTTELISANELLRMEIEARIKAEKELREEQQFTSTVLNKLKNLLLVLDGAGRILCFNEECERLSGYSFDEVRGRIVWDVLIPPEETESIRRFFSSLSPGAVRDQCEGQWLDKHKTLRRIAWSNSAVVDESGSVRHIISTGKYVAEQPVVATNGSLGQATASVLSKREREVLRWLAEGHSSKQIAEELFISVKTVETHRTQIMRRLNIHTIATLTKYAVRAGITTLDR